MRLWVQFNLALSAILILGVVLSGTVLYSSLQRDAATQVLDQAELLLESAASIGAYTAQQVRPAVQSRLSRDSAFLPHTVSAYAASETLFYLKKRYPGYNYKEATLNPTNLRDRAADWEAELIEQFRQDSTRAELRGSRDLPNGSLLFQARPITAGKQCMECHSDPKMAPAAMIKAYGVRNGFGWRLNEVVGAQIVSIPADVAHQIAKHRFLTIALSVVAALVVTLLLVELAFWRLVMVPLQRLCLAADSVSSGDLTQPELPVQGSDEWAQLATSINRLYRSIGKAVRLLDTE
jgi:HAMP domain-containing protein